MSRLWLLLIVLLVAGGVACGQPAPPPIVPEGEHVENAMELIERTPGHMGAVWSAAFAPDGTRIVTASDDQSARVWDARTGAELYRLMGHKESVRSAVYSPDGSRIVTASDDKTARVWDARTGAELLTLGEHKGRVWSAAYSPDGTRIVTASDDKTARVWDARTGAALLTLKGHTSLVRSAAYSPDGKRIVTASADSTDRIWDAMTGAELVRVQVDMKDVWQSAPSDISESATYSPDGKRIVTTAVDNSLRVRDANTGAELLVLQGSLYELDREHVDIVQSAAYSPDGTHIVTASGYSNTAQVWDARTGAKLFSLEGHKGPVQSAAYAPDGTRIVTSSNDETARVWDARTGKQVLSLKPRGLVRDRARMPFEWGFLTYRVAGAAYSPDGTRIVTMWGNKSAHLWDARTDAELLGLSHEFPIESAVFSPDGTQVVTASDDNSALVWDARTGIKLLSLQGLTGAVLSAAYSPDGNRIITTSADKIARVWDARTGAKLLNLEGRDQWVDSAVYSPDGTRIVATSVVMRESNVPDFIAKVWDGQTGTELLSLKGHTDFVRSAAFSPDGTRIVTASDDTTARVWDARSGAELLSLNGHQGLVLSAAYSPDGTRIVTASDDHTARIWDAVTGAELLRLQHGGSVQSAAYSPDGKRLLTASINSTARIWDSATGTPLGILSSAGTRWFGCDLLAKTCLRFDDGSLLPIAPPNEPTQITVAPQPPISLDDGTIGELALNITNQGPGRLYGLGVASAGVPSQTADGGLLYVLSRDAAVAVPPGPNIIPLALLAEAPARTAGPATFSTTVEITSANRKVAEIPLTIHRRAPSIRLADGRPANLGKNEIRVSLTNAGDLDAENLEVAGQIIPPAQSGITPPALTPFNGQRITAGSTAVIAFALPTGLRIPSGSVLDLTVRQLSGMRHVWDGLRVGIAAPPFPWLILLVAGFGTLALVGSGYYARVYRDPIVLELSRAPEKLLKSPPERLRPIRDALRRAGRLERVLDLSEVSQARFSEATAFAAAAEIERLRLLAKRFEAECEPSLVAQDPFPLYEIDLPEHRLMVNLPRLRVAFDDEKYTARDMVDILAERLKGTVGLLVAAKAERRRALAEANNDQGRLVVVAGDGHLAGILFGPDPLATLTDAVASQVRIANISFYRTAAGVTSSAMFFGRERELSQILNRELINYVVVGGRQLGKTSLLKEVERRLARRGDVRCLYFSLMRPGPPWAKIGSALGLPAGTLDEAIVAQLRGGSGERLLVVLVDEADQFVAADLAQGGVDLPRMRTLSEERKCVFFLAGFWELQLATIDYHSPLKNFGETLRIGALEEDACRRLASEPLRALNVRFASDELLADLVRRCGQRANLVAIACDAIVKGLGPADRVVTEAAVEAALGCEAMQQALELGQGIGDTGSPRDQRIDRIIVWGMVEHTSFRLAEVLAIFETARIAVTLEEVRSSLLRLELAFVITQTLGDYRFCVPIFIETLKWKDPAVNVQRELREFLQLGPAV